MTLTATQSRVLTAVETLTQQHGYPPSVREIGDAVGLSSTSSVSHVLHKLEAMGRLALPAPGSPRGIRVVRAAESTCQRCGGRGYIPEEAS